MDDMSYLEEKYKDKNLEYIDRGFHGSVFLLNDDKILKVFDSPLFAYGELNGIKEIEKYNPNFAPEILDCGTIDNKFCIIREDIWDIESYVQDISEKEFVNFIFNISDDNLDLKKMHNVDENYSQTESLEIFHRFREQFSEFEDEMDMFNQDFFKLIIDMALNGHPLNDISFENLGISSSSGELKIRDMSSFAIQENTYNLKFSKQLFQESPMKSFDI